MSFVSPYLLPRRPGSALAQPYGKFLWAELWAELRLQRPTLGAIPYHSQIWRCTATLVGDAGLQLRLGILS